MYMPKSIFYISLSTPSSYPYYNFYSNILLRRIVVDSASTVAALMRARQVPRRGQGLWVTSHEDVFRVTHRYHETAQANCNVHYSIDFGFPKAKKTTWVRALMYTLLPG